MRDHLDDEPLNPYVALSDLGLNLVLILVFFVASVLVVSQVGWEEISTRLPQQKVVEAVKDMPGAGKPVLLNPKLRNDPPGAQRWVFGGGKTKLFNVGTSELTSKGRKSLVDFSKVLRANPAWRRIRIEGHTMPKLQGREDWELSAARAAAVAKVLSGEGRIGAHRLAVSGRGGQTPFLGDPKDARNDRVEIVLEFVSAGDL